jgi:protein JSN1
MQQVVLTTLACSVNFERLDDAVRARKALNGRDVLGSDVGAIRIGFAKVPVKNGQEGGPVLRMTTQMLLPKALVI